MTVARATVNLATERATVVARPEVGVDDITGAVETAGYDARPIVDGESEGQAVAYFAG